MHVKKLHSLTVGNSKFINDVGLVLVKELQCPTDEEHGQALKLSLTRILPKQKQPQIAGLSAVVGKSEDKVKNSRGRPATGKGQIRRGLVETFLGIYDEHFSRQYGFWRPYVEQVIYRYLDCGDLHNGFARVKCKDCGHEYLLAFSCKRYRF